MTLEGKKLPRYFCFKRFVEKFSQFNTIKPIYTGQKGVHSIW